MGFCHQNTGCQCSIQPALGIFSGLYDIAFAEQKNKTKKSYYSSWTGKYKNNIKKTWDVMKEIIGKSKFKIKKIPQRIVIDEKEIIDEKKIGKKFNYFFVNIGLKLASKIPVSNTHFGKYVKYEGPILERKELCNEELRNAFSS